MKIVNKSDFICLTVPGQLNYPNHSLSFVIKGSFNLSNNSEFIPGEVQADIAADLCLSSENAKGESLYYDSDATPFKPSADIIVHGSCYPPNGQASKACKCSVSVGDFQHELVVVGDRYIRSDGFGGRVISDVEPFTSMPLVYEKAAATSFNPVGVELGRGKGKGKGKKLPNIVNESSLNGQRIVDVGESLVGFGPIHREWPNRKELLGTYTEHYLETRWPWYPQDFDFSYFNCAPPWMQIDGYLSGDESINLTNLHPDNSDFKTALPKLKVRCFNQLSNGSWNELPMNLDTCWIDMDKESAVLLWRGWMPVENELHEEVEYLFVIAEPMDEPKSESYWREEFLAEIRRGKDVVHRGAVPSSSPLESNEEDETDQSEGAAFATDHLAGIYAEKPSFTSQIEQDPDLKALYEELPEDVQRELQEGRGEKDLPLQELVGSISELSPEEQKLVYQVSDAFEHGDAKDTLLSLVNAPMDEALVTEIDRIMKLASADELPIDQLQGLPPEQLQVLEKLKSDSDLSFENTSDEISKGPTENEEETPSQILFGPGSDKQGFNLKELERMVRDGISFYDEDFSSLDLTGASLVGGTFIRCSFVNSCLQSADLKQAILVESNFDQANLSSTNLEGARLGSISACSADFSHSDLSGADFSKALLFSANLQSLQAKGTGFADAELGGANMSDSACDHGDFSRANLKAFVAYRSSFESACFHESILDEAVLDYASLVEAKFYKVEGEGLSLISSNVSGIRAAKANLPKLRAQYLKGADSNWVQSSLVAADFLGAELSEASFAQTDLSQSVLSFADLCEANFSYAILDETDILDAKLVKTKFERASIRNSDLSGSNAYAADFHLADVEQVKATDTNLEMTQYATS